MTAALAAVVVLASTAVPARAAEPGLSVSNAKLARALHCQPQVRDARSTPVMLVTGTGFTGREIWVDGGNTALALRAAGHPSCYVDFPAYTTGDVQTSVEYLVSAIRREFRRAGRRIAVYGVSQGGLLPRWALTYWPSLRRMVGDVVSVAGSHHGTDYAGQGPAIADLCATSGCPPAFWQQWVNSKLLKAINGQPDETPGPTSWTTVRTVTDDLVQTQLGPNPASSLRGASNVLIQAVCPGRTTGHVGSAFDSVSIAALLDAIGHRGPARASRFPRRVCATPYGPGLDLATLGPFLDAALGVAANRLLERIYPFVHAEPPVRAYARLRGRTGPR